MGSVVLPSLLLSKNYLWKVKWWGCSETHSQSHCCAEVCPGTLRHLPCPWTPSRDSLNSCFEQRPQCVCLRSCPAGNLDALGVGSRYPGREVGQGAPCRDARTHAVCPQHALLPGGWCQPSSRREPRSPPRGSTPNERAYCVKASLLEKVSLNLGDELGLFNRRFHLCSPTGAPGASAPWTHSCSAQGTFPGLWALPWAGPGQSPSVHPFFPYNSWVTNFSFRELQVSNR